MDTKTQQFMAEVQRLKSFFDEREMFVDETTLGNLASANLEHFGYRDAPNEEPKVETQKYTERDPLFDKAVEVIRTRKRVSTNLLQSALRIGHTKSALLIDQLEEAGIISAKEDGKPRKVL
jgi:DNA segregation ATPase FtsK/SpoIIIE-like protein